MFGLKKKIEEVVKTVVAPPVVLTLSEIVKRHTMPSTGRLSSDFTNIDNQIERNKQTLSFLIRKRDNCYDNENDIYKAKIQEYRDRNERLDEQKCIILKQIEANKVYQKIDLSFMSMKRPAAYKSQIDTHPVFSFHKLVNGRFIRCKLTFNSYGIKILHGSSASFSGFFKHILSIFVDNPSADRSKVNYDKEFVYTPLKWESIKNSVVLESVFRGIVPSSTKNKIDEAKEVFTSAYTGSGNVFLIKDCPNWKYKKQSKEALVVGIVGDQAYIIDKFNTADLDELISKEFAS
jgi:hypothetical protein